MDNIIIDPKDGQRIKELLVTYLADSGVRSVLLVSQSGFILGYAGDFSNIDKNSLAVLASAGVSSTQALAATLGERKFAATSYQGAHQNLHIHILSEKAFLAAVADTSVTSSVVRLYSRELTKELQPIINRIYRKK